MKKENRCLKCGHKWESRVDNPKQCPRCKSTNWQYAWKTKCEICGRNSLLINLHHKDGNNKNNSKDNIIFLCPECHQSIHNQGSSTNRIRKKTRMYKGTKNSQEINFKLNQLRNFWVENAMKRNGGKLYAKRKD